MTTTRTDPSDTTERSTPRRLGRRGWILVAVAVVVAVALTVWLSIGLRPDVANTGSGGVLDKVSVPTRDGDTDRLWWVGKSDGGFWVAVRNDGPAAVTLRGAETSGTLDVRIQFAPVEREYDRFGTAVDSYTLQPGAEVQVRASLHVCGPVVSGSSVSVDQVDLHATTLGVTRTVHVTSLQQYGFYPDAVGGLPRSKAC
ncbi:hypothetical protein [Cellulomonas alba]|uniref:Uncharacterized protein n=1 Tax=Cellulomonas alba TaxID=3053467 RepID=A0ABT7SG98_9CELL|nr:hypothetical protein [Cellulomonas alba]MDM7855218.1 hypothetical protein [Cellulomonas alba]